MSPDSKQEREDKAKRRRLEGQANHPPQTEEDINMDSIEVFLRLTEKFYEEKGWEQEKTEAEIKKLEDEVKLQKKELDERIKSIQDRRKYTIISPILVEQLYIQEDKERASFKSTITNLYEEQRDVQKTGDDTIKRLEHEQQQVITSFSKTFKGLKDALKESKSNELGIHSDKHRRDWLQAKPLSYFLSKIKDPEALLSERQKFETIPHLLFGEYQTMKSCKTIIGCLKFYLREYDWSAMSSVCSILFQLPLFVLQIAPPTINELSSTVPHPNPTGSGSPEYKSVEFDLIPFEMNIVDTDLVTQFQDPDPELLDIFVSLFSNMPQPKRRMNEWESSLITHHIINHLAQLVDMTNPTEIHLKFQAIIRSGKNKIPHFTPDLSLFIGEDTKFLIWECKPFPLIMKKMRASQETLEKTFNGRLKSSLRQLIIRQIEAKCPMGILSDWSTSILIEINLEDFEKNRDKYGIESPEIPVYVKVIDIESVNPSYLQVLYYFICRAIEKRKENEEKMNRLNIKGFLLNKTSAQNPPRSNFPRSNPPASGDTDTQRTQDSEDSVLTFVLQKLRGEKPLVSIPLIYHMTHIDASEDDLVYSSALSSADSSSTVPWSEPGHKHIQVTYIDLEYGDFIQSGPACYQVFKTKAKHFTSVITQDLDPEEIIVGKLFAPSAWEEEENCDLDKKKIEAENHYQMERECTAELMDDPKFNNCYIKHKEFRATIVVPQWDIDWDNPVVEYISGRCVLSKYIESDLRCNEDTYEKAKQQLQVIHDHEIFHKDVADRNILCNDGKVYFIDFGRSEFCSSEEYYQIDRDHLWRCFDDSESEED